VIVGVTADPAAPVATRKKKMAVAEMVGRTKAVVVLGAPGGMTAIVRKGEGAAAATGVTGVAIGIRREIEMKGGRGASVPEAVRLLPGIWTTRRSSTMTELKLLLMTPSK